MRIGATVSPVANTYISAYKKPASSGHVVIVAINKGSGSANVTFQFSGFTAPSVTPYVSNGTLNLTPQSAISSTGGSFSYSLFHSASRPLLLRSGWGACARGPVVRFTDCSRPIGKSSHQQP